MKGMKGVGGLMLFLLLGATIFGTIFVSAGGIDKASFWFSNMGTKAVLGDKTPGMVIYTGDVALRIGGQNAISSALALSVNLEIDGDKGYMLGETSITANPTEAETKAPHSMLYTMWIGNDDSQSTTDRGTEYYYREISGGYTGAQGAIVLKDTEKGADNIQLYAESTAITWRGYDDNVYESTLNVTVGSTVVATTKLRLQPEASTTIGNPDAPGDQLGICFNTSTLGDWDEIKVQGAVGTFSPCQSEHGTNMMADCYIINTPALIDDQYFDIYVTLDPASGATVDGTDYIYATVWDKTMRKDDTGKKMWDWCDDSAEGTDKDPGIDGSANGKVIHLN